MMQMLTFLQSSLWSPLLPGSSPANILPLEVWELVMDELNVNSDTVERWQSLESCSLVSRSWRHMAQRRILYKVSISGTPILSKYLDYAMAHPQFGTSIRELHINGYCGFISFKALYDVLAATPYLKSLSLRDLEFFHWPVNVVMLNPVKRLDMSRISIGDGTCTARHLLECFRGLFHDVEELVLGPCDAHFLNAYHGASPYLRLRKLVLLGVNAELLAFLCRTIASCASLDMTVPATLDVSDLLQSIGPTVERLSLKLDITDSGPSNQEHPTLSLRGLTSLNTVYLHLEDYLHFEGDDTDFWPIRSKILRTLPPSVTSLCISLNVGTSDASANRIGPHYLLFKRLNKLRRLMFIACPPTYDEENPRLADSELAYVDLQLQRALPSLHAQGVLQPFSASHEF